MAWTEVSPSSGSLGSQWMRGVRMPRRQAGITLVEFMVSIVLGMLLVAVLATLIVNQSGNRREVDRAGRIIETGRYALDQIAADVRMAGYWGELGSTPAVPGALPDPCSVTAADLDAAMGMPVQGYDAPTSLSLSCVSNHLPGTDVLVVRRVDPDSSDVETSGAVDWAKLTNGRIYLQTGLESGGYEFMHRVGQATSSASTNQVTFPLKKKNQTTPATIRKMLVYIYYISKCSVEVSGACPASADGGKPIPTLKRVELGVSGGSPVFSTITIAEGIENMQVDFGVDTDGDGTVTDALSNGSSFTLADWSNVMSMRVHLLARSLEQSPGFQDAKGYDMGTAGTVSAAAGTLGYRRHQFSQAMRLINPIGRRAL